MDQEMTQSRRNAVTPERIAELRRLRETAVDWAGSRYAIREREEARAELVRSVPALLDEIERLRGVMEKIAATKPTDLAYSADLRWIIVEVAREALGKR